MTTRNSVGKNGPRVSTGHIMEGLRSEYETRKHNDVSNETLVYAGTADQHALYRRYAAKIERVDAEKKGIRGRFVPKSERQGKVPEVIERYNPEPRMVEAKVRFSGRDKLAVPGYGPAYRVSK